MTYAIDRVNEDTCIGNVLMRVRYLTYLGFAAAAVHKERVERRGYPLEAKGRELDDDPGRISSGTMSNCETLRR